MATSFHGQVIEGLDISGGVLVAHNATVRNCRVVGTPDAGGAGYTIKFAAAVNLDMADTEVICRSADTKAIAVLGGASLTMVRSVARGGEDALYVKTTGSVDATESWFGDVQRFAGSHTDVIQIEQVNGAVFTRCRIEGFTLADGGDPFTDEADGSVLSAGGIICTQDSGASTQIDGVHLVDSWIEGAIWTVYLDPNDGLTPTDTRVTGCRFGTAHSSGPLNVPGDTALANNTWGESGTTACCGPVTAGTPIGG